MDRNRCKLHDREFVAAEPRDGVVFGHAFAEPAGNFLQQRIADRMAERVVDFLEMIEIEAEHRELVATLDEPQRLLELFAEQRPVRQIGQRVVARHVRNLFLGLRPFGDVLERRDPAAAPHRLIDNTDRTSALDHRPRRGVARARFRDQTADELRGVTLPLTARLLIHENVDQQTAFER
jgi:hypothetical protein